MNPAQAILIFLVRVYRWTLSPLKSAVLGPQARCRFSPSCSAYALEAIRRHGAVRGVGLSIRRLLRCHPWGGCGEDPVPPRAVHGTTGGAVSPGAAGRRGAGWPGHDISRSFH